MGIDKIEIISKSIELKKCIIVSAVNLFEGGPLSVLKDCLTYVYNSDLPKKYKIIVLVHKRSLFPKELFEEIDFVEFPYARTSYFKRLYLEYHLFRKQFGHMPISLWLSMHDITPNLPERISQAVYCHNPSPFKKLALSDLFFQPSLFFFTLFYKYLYRINIRKNKYVIVQQQWMRKKFSMLYKIDERKIIVARPNMVNSSPITNHSGNDKLFIFPTLARPFKNIEVICKAVEVLADRSIRDFKCVITIDGTENNYSKYLVKKYSSLPQILFTGKLDRNKVYDYYERSTALIFPSKLETWGMPISEYKEFGKAIIVADLPYARETINDYERAKFFNADDHESLAQILTSLILKEQLAYDKTEAIVYDKPFTKNWSELFSILLNTSSNN